MTTSHSTWKQRERQAASLFGTRRAPLSGSNGGQTGSDSLHPRVYIECKLRAKSAVHALYDRTAAVAKQEGKTPVLALAQKNRPGVLLVCRPADLAALAAELEAAGNARFRGNTSMYQNDTSKNQAKNAEIDPSKPTTCGRCAKIGEVK